MSVLVVGANGQLGAALCDAYRSHALTAVTHDDLDIASEAAVVDVVASVGPSLVVNAAALTDVDACERDPDGAHAVNALGPWWLARACSRVDATLVTVSTDYVFGGRVAVDADGRPRPFTEFDPVEPVNAYGRSKVAGEQLVRQTLPAHHIVRTAWLAAAAGSSFVARLLARAREGQPLRVVDDQTSTPSFVDDVAGAIVEIAASGRYGTWHRTNHGWCTRFELANQVLDLAGIDVPLHPATSDEFADLAPRPGWSVLDNAHAEACGFARLPDWRDGLRRLMRGSDGADDEAGGT